MDDQRIWMKIYELEQYLNDIKTYLPESEDEFTSDPLHYYAIEHILQNSIECVLDICFMLIRFFGLPPPNDEESVLDTLKDKISSIETLKEMKQFRNVLVHKYGEVDTGKVYENASTVSMIFMHLWTKSNKY